MLDWTLPGETEMGSAGEQPIKGYLGQAHQTMSGRGVNCGAAFGIFFLAVALIKISTVGTLPLRMAMVTGSIEYVSSGFIQQFFLCSVVLVSLAKISVFRGWLRLPAALGACFGIMHLWIPLSAAPERFWIELSGVIGVAGLGFVASAYFLLFRTMIPLTLFHAVTFGITQYWIHSLPLS